MDNKIFTLLICLTLASCGGINSFHEYARAGDTVAIPVGMQPDFSKDNITVTITPSSGPDIVLTATDPSIRAVMNLYPDPVSNMLVSRAMPDGDDTSPFAKTYASSLLVSSNDDKDWYQTTVFLDLPPEANLPTGLAQVEINNGVGATHSVTLEIIPGTGVANSFDSNFNGGLVLNPNILDSLARAEHTTVTLDSATIPHAVELTFTHDPDITQSGGSGKAFVINPLGYLKNVSWNDDGTNLKVIMMQSNDGIIDNMNDYKFYIAGTATNLQLQALSVKGYNINGGDHTDPITTTLTASN